MVRSEATGRCVPRRQYERGRRRNGCERSMRCFIAAEEKDLLRWLLDNKNALPGQAAPRPRHPCNLAGEPNGDVLSDNRSSGESYFLRRGNPENKGERLTPGFLDVLMRHPDREQHWLIPRPSMVGSSLGRRWPIGSSTSIRGPAPDRPRHRQSSVAASFWRRAGANPERFWRPRRTAHASGTA